MKYLQKQQLLEQVIYLSMWLLILCIPPINLLLDDDHTLQAGELKNVILETGMLVLPFFVLFLIHNFLLIPQLFLKKYYVRYMLAVIFTIGILFLYMPGWLEALHPEPPLQGQKERTFEPAESWLPLPPASVNAGFRERTPSYPSSVPGHSHCDCGPAGWI